MVRIRNQTDYSFAFDPNVKSKLAGWLRYVHPNILKFRDYQVPSNKDTNHTLLCFELAPAKLYFMSLAAL